MSRFALIWLLVATTVWAQESPSPPVEKSAPPTEDAIAAAKRDFNAIRGARGASDSSNADLSSLSAPELQTTAPLPRLQSTPKADSGAANKNANWLVDAMMKQDGKEARDSHEPISTAIQHDGETTSAQDQRTSANPRAANAEGNLSVAEKRTGPEFNPLARYMVGWMTPQDYALLKPGLDGAAAASLTSRGDPSLPAVGSDLSVLGDTGSALDLGAMNKAAPFALPKPADNPFLQSINGGGASTSGAFVTAAAPSLPAASISLTPVPVEVAPVKSKIPDFAKPAMDEKYFKQLKRF